MLLFVALGNTKVLSFALGDAKVPNVNGFASQWNIGLRDNVSERKIERKNFYIRQWAHRSLYAIR